MKVIITGGCGFIGSHTSDLLEEAKYDVIVIDKKLKNTNPKIKYYEQDILNYDEIDKIFEKEQPELVIHLAAQVSVPESIKDPINDARQNIIGTINLLNLSNKYKVKNFVFSSSCAVYGEPKTKLVSEQHEINPKSPYAASKLACEKYVEILSKNHVILRYGNVYGPRQESTGEGAVIQTFASRMKENKLINIHGDGNQVRDFVYVKDIAKANLKAIQSRKKLTLNIGTSKGTSINQVFNTLKQITNYELKPIYTSKREGDIYQMILNSEKSQREISFFPKTQIEQGLRETITA